MSTPDLLTIEEAAEALRCSEKTVRRLIDAGLPAMRVGRGWRIPRESIERRIAEAIARAPAAELEPAATFDPSNLDPRPTMAAPAGFVMTAGRRRTR